MEFDESFRKKNHLQTPEERSSCLISIAQSILATNTCVFLSEGSRILSEEQASESIDI